MQNQEDVSEKIMLGSQKYNAHFPIYKNISSKHTN